MKSVKEYFHRHLICKSVTGLLFIIILIQLWRFFTSFNNLPKLMKDEQIDIELTDFMSGNYITVEDTVKKITNCTDRPVSFKKEELNHYWVLYNYMPAKKQFRCSESITFSTHADYSYLSNIIPLVHHWRGPISLALFAPGDDLQKAIDSIRYLRDCTSPLIREYVTYHVFYHKNHVPKKILPREELKKDYNCSMEAPYLNVQNMYKDRMKLWYPINVARNIARRGATTHYLLASDIELYPNPGLINNFLEMIARNSTVLHDTNPKVFALAAFEVAANEEVPVSKTKLRAMLQNGKAIQFHKNVCPLCHEIPGSHKWQEAKETKSLDVFYVVKRKDLFKHWEPYFIGTNAEPFYEDRLSLEKISDKTIQAYLLCLFNYDFMLLNNAFLVHKPGIKVNRINSTDVRVMRNDRVVLKDILTLCKMFYTFKIGFEFCLNIEHC